MTRFCFHGFIVDWQLSFTFRQTDEMITSILHALADLLPLVNARARVRCIRSTRMRASVST